MSQSNLCEFALVYYVLNVLFLGFPVGVPASFDIHGVSGGRKGDRAGSACSTLAIRTLKVAGMDTNSESFCYKIT